jgi:uncharacterized membrane protein YfcA
MDASLWLIALGFVLGVLGTLIGAGGGFVLMPVLLLLYPKDSPEVLTSISLAVVFFNAASGSWAYARMKRIDYRSGLVFAAATIPGAMIGAWSTGYIPRRSFNLVFGVLMVIAAAYLFLNRTRPQDPDRETPKGHTTRTLVEAGGQTHTYSFDIRIGTYLSLLVGYLSSLLGIGGGIVHVPVLVRLLNFPVHIATATSHFVLAIMALAGTLVHIATGSFSQGGVQRTAFLAIGVLAGAQLGAALSSRVHGKWIIRALALALAFVGIRILFLAHG